MSSGNEYYNGTKEDLPYLIGWYIRLKLENTQDLEGLKRICEKLTFSAFAGMR